MGNPMNRAQLESERLGAHVRAHATTHLAEKVEGDEGSWGTPEIFLVTLGVEIIHAGHALSELDRLNDGVPVQTQTDHLGDPDRIEIRYQNDTCGWESTTWWDPSLDDTQLEIYTRLRSDGMGSLEAKLCAAELGAA